MVCQTEGTAVIDIICALPDAGPLGVLIQIDTRKLIVCHASAGIGVAETERILCVADRGFLIEALRRVVAH